MIRKLFSVDVRGLENLPVSGPAILSPNHRSFFDSPLLMIMAPRPVVFLGKAEYMDSAKTKYLFPAFGMVPIKREAQRASMAALDTAADLLDEGRLVGIYPEGTRSRDGMLHRGHTGVTHLALMTNAPIIPVGLTGTERVQPIDAPLPRPFQGPVTMTFGRAIRPADYRFGGKRHRRQQMLDDVMASVASMSSQTRSPDFASGEPPLIRGGSETVYRVSRHGAVGSGWRQAAEQALGEAIGQFDDGRVGEVADLSVRVLPSGDIRFAAEITVSTRFRPEAAPGSTDPGPGASTGSKRSSIPELSRIGRGRHG